MIATIIAGLGLLLAAGGSISSNIVNKIGSKLRSQLLAIANSLASQISKNNALLDKLTNAYQNRNSQLLTEMMSGMGYGARMEALISSLNKNEDEYQKTVADLKQANISLEKQVNEVNAATTNAGTGFTGNRLAQETVNKYSHVEIDKADQSQNVDGGIVNDSINSPATKMIS
jgi:hypothetical protein